MYGYYEGIIELVRTPGFFTDEMEQEICTLRKQLEDGNDDDTFPWEHYEDLWYRKRLSSLPENYKSLALERLREIVKQMKENYTDITRALMIPITEANAGKHVKRLEALKARRDRLSRALETHKQLEAIEQQMFVPDLGTASALPSNSPVSDWNGLLCQPEKFGSTELIDTFKTVGLLSDNGMPTDWGIKSKGAWAGAIAALTKPPALLTVNTRAVVRCLAQWGVTIAENTLRANTSAEADNMEKAVNAAIKQYAA